jgi:hypothetical protein
MWEKAKPPSPDRKVKVPVAPVAPDAPEPVAKKKPAVKKTSGKAKRNPTKEKG